MNDVLYLATAADSSGLTAHLKWKLLLVLFNMNKGVDDPVDYLLVGVLTTSVTAKTFRQI